MKFFVTYEERVVHTVPVEANSYEEAASVADHIVTAHPGKYCVEKDWYLQSVSKAPLEFVNN